MYKRGVVTCLILCTLPFVAAADSTTTTRLSGAIAQQISALLAQVQQLQAQLGQLQGASSAASSTPLAKPIDVFLIGGQSNAAGAGDASQSPVPPSGEVFQYLNGCFFGSICPAEGYIKDGVDPIGYGPGDAWAAFGIAYYDATNHPIIFVPSAVGGTSLVPQPGDATSSTWAPSGNRFDISVQMLNAAMDMLQQQGYAPVFKGVLWSQGEDEAGYIQLGLMSVDTYKNALIALIARYRALYGPTMPFYIFRTGTGLGSSDVGFAAVRQAQEEVAAEVPYTFIVFRGASDFAALGLMNPVDKIHYTQAGYNEMGSVGGATVARISLGTWPAPSGSIQASPNPCIANATGFCTSTISWTLSDSVYKAQVWVSEDGQPEIALTGNFVNNAGEAEAPWIAAGYTFVFNLYDYSSDSRGASLGQVSVTGTRPSIGTISASPNPCTVSAGQKMCASNISWTVPANTSITQVWVSVSGATPLLLGCITGSYQTVAPWIVPGFNYIFTLYSATSCDLSGRGSSLASVTVNSVVATSTVTSSGATASTSVAYANLANPLEAFKSALMAFLQM